MKHIYFVSETNGFISFIQLWLVKKSQNYYDREHFKAISGDNVIYDVMDSYTSPMEKVMK